MNWIKKGLIFEPHGQFYWVKTHAMLPVADRINEDIYRIYFSGRDNKNRSLIGAVDININEPKKILRITEEPVLSLGSLGCFDDNGVSPTFIVNYEGKKYFYYMGWNMGSTVRAAEVTGLAISEDNGETFKRFSRAPILHRTDSEPYSILVISCILIEDGVWKMWYDSANVWLNKDLPSYNIKYAESTDGINWNMTGQTAINFKDSDETRVSRASVLKEDGIYKMWFCYAMGSGGYRMGYAVSTDGINWDRKDEESGINLSDAGWDSEMVCYPYVFKNKGIKYMLYCGNSYGKTGFGYAVWED
ncbi:MAG: hypothetical protein AB7V00_06300 [Bacilli bacterium]